MKFNKIMAKILINDNVHPILWRTLEEAGFTCDIAPNLTYDEVLKIIGNYQVLVVRSKINIDRNFIDNSLNLKCIARVGAGMETIDVEYAESRGIMCLNSPEGNRTAVGEHTLGLLLSLFNNIPQANFEVHKGLWQREENRGLEIAGKTIAIIGFGNMGSSFAKCLQGFDCNILAYDKYKTNYAPNYVKESTLQECFANADVVSFHVPLTDETRYYADEKFFKNFRKPIFLLNTSRGAVVKTSALAEVVKNGKVVGAALDVVEYENMAKDGLNISTLPKDFRYLISVKNVIFTPHVAGWTKESKVKLAGVLAEKIVNTLKTNNL